MKAITLTQPWATLVAIGAKEIETRSWRTTYRGELAIHAAKSFPFAARALCGQEPFRSTLLTANIPGYGYNPANFNVSGLPLGFIVATCILEECTPTELLNRAAITTDEIAFGDFGPKRWQWILSNIHAMPRPIAAKGALSLWEWDSRQEAQP